MAIIESPNESHPYHRDLQGLNEFIRAYCGGSTQLIACAEAAWYYCMRRNQPEEVSQKGGK